MTTFATFLLVCSLVLSLNSFVLAEDNPSGHPPTGAIILDILVLRPLGFCGTILGASAFVMSLPVSIPSKKMDEVLENVVMVPYGFTFERPLGKIGENMVF